MKLLMNAKERVDRYVYQRKVQLVKTHGFYGHRYSGPCFFVFYQLFIEVQKYALVERRRMADAIDFTMFIEYSYYIFGRSF